MRFGVYHVGGGTEMVGFRDYLRTWVSSCSLYMYIYILIIYFIFYFKIYLFCFIYLFCERGVISEHDLNGCSADVHLGGGKLFRFRTFQKTEVLEEGLFTEEAQHLQFFAIFWGRKNE